MLIPKGGRKRIRPRLNTTHSAEALADWREKARAARETGQERKYHSLSGQIERCRIAAKGKDFSRLRFVREHAGEARRHLAKAQEHMRVAKAAALSPAVVAAAEAAVREMGLAEGAMCRMEEGVR